ncbi:MAG: hypothetical protein WDN27_05835 [Candidatus Saccharibacteria bacterium]
MAINTPENPLLVFEYSGTGRSGKGTIVKDLLDIAPSIASEETVQTIESSPFHCFSRAKLKRAC